MNVVSIYRRQMAMDEYSEGEMNASPMLAFWSKTGMVVGLLWCGETLQLITELSASSLTAISMLKNIVTISSFQLFFCSYNAMALVSFCNRTMAARIQQFLQQQETDILPWPAASSDISLIEHVCDEMKRRLQRLFQAPVIIQELRQQLVRIWNDIISDILGHRYRS